MKLMYHQAAYDLLGRSPAISQNSVILIERLEEALGRELPASVREWYSLDGAVDILAEYSNQDHPVALASLGDLSRRISREALARNLLLVMDENQSVCHWAVSLDGSDDPPVLVNLEAISPQLTWTQYADRFSTFVYTRIWDWQIPGFADSVFSLEPPLEREGLDRLRTKFREGPDTYGWPGKTNYRFFDGNSRILIMDDEERQADWWLCADSPDALERLMEVVKDCGMVGSDVSSF